MLNGTIVSGVENSMIYVEILWNIKLIRENKSNNEPYNFNKWQCFVEKKQNLIYYSMLLCELKVAGKNKSLA